MTRLHLTGCESICTASATATNNNCAAYLHKRRLHFRFRPMYAAAAAVGKGGVATAAPGI